METYRTITKLGYGAGSTVWLAGNLEWRSRNTRESPQYVTVKVGTQTPGNMNSRTQELALSNIIATTNPSHPDTRFIRSPIDNFQIHGPHGLHTCLVYHPMGETLFPLSRQRRWRTTFSVGSVYFDICLKAVCYSCMGSVRHRWRRAGDILPGGPKSTMTAKVMATVMVRSGNSNGDK